MQLTSVPGTCVSMAARIRRLMNLSVFDQPVLFLDRPYCQSILFRAMQNAFQLRAPY